MPSFYLATVAIHFNESIHKVNESDEMVRLSIVLSKKLSANFNVTVKVDDDRSNAISKLYMYFYAF